MATLLSQIVVALSIFVASAGIAGDPPEQAARPRTFMMVVAHPDDEAIIGGVLARLAREGHSVLLVIATDGKYGTRVTSIPEGDELGKIRKKESQCFAQALGIAPPIFLSIDRLDTKNGVRSYLEGRKRFLKILAAQLAASRPDVLLTYGPDGEYGHPEHIVASAALTEILLRDGLVEEYPLYYIAWQKEQVQDDDSLSFVDPRYLGAISRFSDADEKKSFEAAKCFRSQYTQTEIDDLIKGASKSENVVRFRRFRADLFPAESPLTEL